jgi:peroxiredoxin
MKLTILTILSAIGLMTAPAQSQAAPVVGEPAPNFKAVDTNGNEISLSDYKGKNVVLEWSNHECPFVVKHYEPGNMQKLQKPTTDGGDIWITIVSSAEGKQGSTTPEQANQVMKDVGAHSTARILDPSGDIGKLYAAKTTPHMFVIDKEGVLAYAGAIDSDTGFSSAGIKGATNYVMAALDDLNAGQPVKVASTKPYGCSVKY